MNITDEDNFSSANFWWEIELSGNSEELLSIIDVSGSIGSSFKPDGSENTAVAYYVSSKPLEYWMEKLNSLAPYFGSVSILGSGKVEARDWHTDWKEAFPPLDVGSGFTVLAPWHRGKLDKKPDGRIPLYIYPATAFGTGYHESTRIALTLLERNGEKVRGGKCADIGTGSGILAIAALKLGAGFVHVRDIDPTVLAEVRNNMKENGIPEDAAELLTGDLLKGFGGGADLDMLTANILCEPLCSMLPDVKNVLKSDGAAVFSGLLLRERDGFIASAAEFGLSLGEELSENEWWGACFRNSQR